MITLLIKKTGFVMSSVLWGIMGFLVSCKGKSTLIYDSFSDFLKEYADLEATRQACVKAIIHYDNVFVPMFGLFITGYALNLKEALKNKDVPAKNEYTLMLLFPVVALFYMTADWVENGLFLQGISDSTLSVPCFKLLQYAKWFLGLGTLTVLILTDLLGLKKPWSVLKGVLYAVLLMGASYGILYLICKF